MNILFLCTGNSCRSQIAEGFTRHLWRGTHNAFSAGTKKSSLNPYAKKVMQEIGIDISRQTSKTIDELEMKTFDVVFTVCSNAQEDCPYFPAKRVIHKGFDDPPHLTAEMSNEEEILSVYRRVRDEIRVFVEELDKTLEIKS